MLKKCPLDEINGTEKALFFLSRAPTYHSFNFNSRFLYQLKYNVPLSKSMCEIFDFRFLFVFIKVIFLLNKKYELFDFKTS